MDATSSASDSDEPCSSTHRPRLRSRAKTADPACCQWPSCKDYFQSRDSLINALDLSVYSPFNAPVLKELESTLSHCLTELESRLSKYIKSSKASEAASDIDEPPSESESTFLNRAYALLDSGKKDLANVTSSIASISPSKAFEASLDVPSVMNHLHGMHELLGQLALFRPTTSTFSDFLPLTALARLREMLPSSPLSATTPPPTPKAKRRPSLSLTIPNIPSLNAVRTYLAEESERLQDNIQLLSASLPRPDMHAAFDYAIATAKEEASHLSAVFTHARDDLAFALREGARRLLTYDELPQEWKNNQYIISGYRFIPIDRWKELLLSGVQWHNETINIYTHVFGAVSVAYLIWTFPTTIQGNPETSSTLDRFINLVFLGAALKCMTLSAAWHLFAGCGTIGYFSGLACMDYMGVSALIAASLLTMIHYGFMCRPDLFAIYGGFIGVVGLTGLILPWAKWFNRRENLKWRIAFFLTLCASVFVPQGHMAKLYGFWNTIDFFAPILFSTTAYVIGLVMYACHWPERARPGGMFDTLFASHQFWHVAIVSAVWLHWYATSLWHVEGKEGYSCAPENALVKGPIEWTMEYIKSEL